MTGDLSEVKIELRPHIGVMDSPLGPVHVEHDQWIVVAVVGDMKQQVGYMRKASGAPLLLTPSREEAYSQYGPLMVEKLDKLAAAERDKALGVKPAKVEPVAADK